jgi:RNA polymerase sigma factor (sigma-70 family)
MQEELHKAAKLARRICSWNAARRSHVDDCVQEAQIAVWKASQTYDASRGTSLWQYACFAVQGAVIDYLRSKSVKAIDRIGTSTPVRFAPVEDAESVAVVPPVEPPTNSFMESLDGLNEREKDILYRYFWLGEVAGDIQDAYKISESRVHQLRRDALRKLRERLEPAEKRPEAENRQKPTRRWYDVRAVPVAERREVPSPEDNVLAFVRDLR